MNDLNKSIFGGIERLLGRQGLANIASSHVIVLGIGGVGSWCAEALVRSGLGEITLVDPDEICITNINRQLLATTKNVGQAKVMALKERLLAISPECKINTICDFFDEKTFNQILDTNPSYVVDAIDRLKNKKLAIYECLKRDIPLITVGAAGGKSDPTRVKIDDLARTKQDPLLFRLRKKMRQENFRKDRPKMGITVVYSDEPLMYPDENGKMCKTPQSPLMKLDCHQGLGTASFITGTFGLVSAYYVLKKLAESKDDLSVN